jgi:hypothetical protein
MTKEDIKVLKQALKILKANWGKCPCKEKYATCVQCWMDLSILMLEGVVNLGAIED